MAFTLKRCEDPQEWDAFVEDSAHGNVFCSTKFLAAIGVDAEFVVVEKQGMIAAGAPLLSRNGRPVRAPHPFTMYQGVLLARSLCDLPPHRAPASQHEAVSTLLGELVRREQLPSFCLHYNFVDVRPFQWFQYDSSRQTGVFDVIPRYTGLIQTAGFKSFDDFLGSVRDVRRQEARKAERVGITIENSHDVDSLDRLHELTFQRQGLVRDPGEQTLLRAITTASLEQGWGRLLVGRDPTGLALSAALFIWDNRCAYYLFGANHPDGRKSGVGTKVVLEHIRHLFEGGFKRIDMVGINSPNRGDFKVSFNAEPKAYFIIRPREAKGIA